MNFGKNDSHRPAVEYHEQHRVLKEQIEIDVADEVSLCYCQLHDDEDALDVPWDVVVEHNDDYGVGGEDVPDSQILLLLCSFVCNIDVGNWVAQEAVVVRSSLNMAAEVDSILKHVKSIGKKTVFVWEIH